VELSDQGWYNNALWVEPTDAAAMNVVVGGLDLWRSSGVGTDLVKISDFRRGTVPGDSAHADQHAIVHRAGYNGTNNRVVFVANDGGVQASVDIMRQGTTGWTRLQGLGVTQFFGAAVNNTTGVILAGNQDNHTLQHPGSGYDWTAIDVDNAYSDGGFCAVASGNPGVFFGERQLLQVFRSTDGGLTGQMITTGLADAATDRAPFIAPLVLDPNDPDRLFGGARNLWRCSNARAATPTWSVMRPSIPHRSGPPRADPFVSAVAVAEGDADLMFVAYDDGQIWRSTDATAGTPTWTRADALMPSLACTCIAIDRSDHAKVWATFSGFTRSTVWRSTDGGRTWVVRSGAGARQLPEIPVSTIALHRTEPDWVYVGTDLGVFASTDAGATWSAATDGPANVVVDQLLWRGDYTLVAVTHGRGIFEGDVGPDRVPVPGRTIRASESSAAVGGDAQSAFPSLSADGRYVCFTSGATNLVPDDTGNWNDVFVHDRVFRQTTRVSVPTAGSQFRQASSHSNYGSISGDGRLVAFDSTATNLVRGDFNGTASDVFVHDRVTGLTAYVSVSSSGQQGNGASTTPSISPNGRYVAFASRATNLVPNDTNLKTDVFLHDLLTRRTERVSVSSGGLQADGDCSLPSVADNGAVVFLSSAINLVTPDANLAVVDVFLHDPNTRTTVRGNESSAGVQADRPGFDGPRISADGNFVAFDSLSAILVDGDNNGQPDVFWRDVAMAMTRRVSVSSGGQEGNGFSRQAGLSASGRFVTFESAATNLVPGDSNGRNDVFVHDTTTGMTARVSVSSTGQEGDGDSGRVPGSTGLFSSGVSADGRITAFSSSATNLVPNDTNGRGDIFVHDAFPVVATNDTARPGARVRITIHAPDDANRAYVAAASLGTMPGIGIDHRVFPLNADSLFFMSLGTPAVFQDFVGRLDGDGKATATINLPPFSFLIGLRFFVASFTVRPGAPSDIGTISLPLPLLVVP